MLGWEDVGSGERVDVMIHALFMKEFCCWITSKIEAEIKGGEGDDESEREREREREREWEREGGKEENKKIVNKKEYFFLFWGKREKFRYSKKRV